MPDQTGTELKKIQAEAETYRVAPYAIQAACAGDPESFKMLVNAGCPPWTEAFGHICLSKRRQNTVHSNVVGAAAYWGRYKVLRIVLESLPQETIDAPALESPDGRRAVKGGPFHPELNGYTPLMLAIVGPQPSLECVKALLARQANYRVRETSTGNNILHLAAEKCASDAVFDYLFENVKVDIFERNDAGHTSLTLCEQSLYKNQRRIEKINAVQAIYDESGKRTESLLDELMAEEDKKVKVA